MPRFFSASLFASPFLSVALCSLLWLAPAASAASLTVTVKKGDTLYGLAHASGLSVGQLQALNGLKDSNIHVGQVLRLRGTVSQPSPPARPQSNRATPSAFKAISGVYTVKSGDTLGKIAAAYHLSIRQLQALNGLTGSSIRVGQRLRVSGQAVPASQFSAARPVSASAQGGYTVRPGDTLGEIASRYGVTVLALQDRNGLSGTVIQVGQRLSIPARGAGVGQSAPRIPAGMEARTIYTYVRVGLRDTPTSFAQRYNTTTAALRRLNGLSSARQITVGAKLLVPSRVAVPVPPRPQHSAVSLRTVTVRGVRVSVVRVDLRWRNVLVTPVLSVRGTAFDAGATVQGLAQISGAQAVINGSYFHPRTYAPAGDIVKDGRLMTWGRIPAALAITPDNRAKITGSTTAILGRPLDSTWNGMETVIASGPRLVSGGVVQTSYSRVFQDPAVFGAAPRSAIGLQSSRDLLLVNTAARVSVGEMGRIMAALGARDALLLDGGSSAGLSYGGSPILRSVRKVSYGIGVYSNYTGHRYAR